MDNRTAIAGYVACLLRFPGESNEAALERFYQYYRSGVSSTADVVAEFAHRGTAMTPRMLQDQLGSVVVDQTGLSPESIELYVSALGESRREGLLKRAAQALSAGDMASAQKLLTQADEANETVSSTLSLTEHIAAGMQLFYQEQERLTAGIRPVTFPWDGMNELVSVGDDDIVLITGQTKVGKSSAAHQISMYNAMQGLKVSYFHNEDSIRRVRNRRIAQLQVHFDRHLTGSGYSYSSLNKRTVKNSESIARIDQTNELAVRLMGDRLTYVYCPGWTPEQIVAKWRNLVFTHGVQLVVIDYLNKIEVGEHVKARGNSVVYGLEQAVELFKRQAGQSGHETPCILIQQENDDGSARDLRSSYIKAQVHITLHRDPAGDKIILLRANDGQPGEVPARFYEPYLLWIGR